MTVVGAILFRYMAPTGGPGVKPLDDFGCPALGF